MVRDERGEPVVCVLVEPATHYYQVMTRSARMASLAGELVRRGGDCPRLVFDSGAWGG